VANEHAPKTAYRVTARVKPTPAHHLYWDVAFAYLQIWVFAADAKDAAAKASDVLPVLPFELVTPKLEVVHYTLPLPDEYQRSQSDLQNVGISLFLVAVRTGADDDGFSTELEDRPT
jgi:hypothetical protein